MFKIVVLDRSAESRNRIVERISEILAEGVQEFHFIPRVSLKPLTLEELKFNGTPDVCIVGSEIVEEDITELGRIRKLVPDAALLVKLPASFSSLTSVEQLARMGVDDFITEELSSRAFLQRIILLSQKKPTPHHGKLVLVSGGKGGVGVTSVAAGIAETLINNGKKVVLVDLDFETQDLSRFLQARPFLNENLQLLIDQSFSITEESVRDCLVQIWGDEPNLLVMPPFPEGRNIYENINKVVRVLLAVFEQLDSMCDCVVVDSGAATGPLLEMLYRIADRVVYPVTNDPAALYASVDRVSKMKLVMGETATFSIVENELSTCGLTGAVVREEFNRASAMTADQWAPEAIPFCKRGARWPGSGATIVGQGRDVVTQAFSSLVASLGLIESPTAKKAFKKFSFFPKLSRKEKRVRADVQGPVVLTSQKLILGTPEGDSLPAIVCPANIKELNAQAEAEAVSEKRRLISGARVS